MKESPLKLYPLKRMMAILFLLLPEKEVLKIDPKDVIRSILLSENISKEIENKITKYVEKYNDFGISKAVIDTDE